jgi:dTDP-4-amino-4,6-dideoxygalactose transaminase
MKISFSPPYVDDTVIDEVVDSLRSGWITTGPKVKALEDQICKYSNSPAVLCVNSWTSGAIMMLKWLGVKEGDEVILPAYTYSATALAVLHAGAKPVMVDVYDDFNISVLEIRKAITNKTKAIIPVDIAGWPCDYNEIMALVCSDEIKRIFISTSEVQQKLGRIMVLNDAAHSLGAKYNGKNIGTEADVTIFSLHAVKNITTAEGGAICLNLPKPFDNHLLYKELRQMSLNCQTKDAFSKSKAGGWKYDIVDFGMKINMPDVNAAIGLAQMRQYSKLLIERKRISERYHEAFSTIDWVLLPPQISERKESSYHIYALRIPTLSEEQRDLLIQKVSEKGVAVNVHFIPMPMLTFFKNQGFDIADYPQAFKNYSCEISLPIYPQLSDAEVDYVIESVKTAYKETIKHD